MVSRGRTLVTVALSLPLGCLVAVATCLCFQRSSAFEHAPRAVALQGACPLPFVGRACLWGLAVYMLALASCSLAALGPRWPVQAQQESNHGLVCERV